MAKKKVLVIEAHSDDSCISISGYLEKYKKELEINFVLCCASDLDLHHYGLVTRDQRLNEYKDYVNYFKGNWITNKYLPFDNESRLDLIPKRDLVSQIESAIALVKPDILFCQGPSFHHDHTIVYEAMVAATRPTARYYPKEILIMENPTYVHSLGPQTDFKPNYYISLTKDQLNIKLELFKKFFPSQIREDKNYLSHAGIKKWASYRGIEARCEYAEALNIFIKRD